MPTRPDLHRRRQARYAYLNEIKARTPCADCKQLHHPCAVDFDHIANDKLDALSSMALRTVSMAVIDAEIKKCEVVCSNCHRMRTHLRREAKKNRQAPFV